MKTCFTIKLSPFNMAILDIIEMPFLGHVITRINVPAGFRGKGHGRELLRQCIEAADAEHLPLYLNINPYGELTYKELKEWYSRYGFELWEEHYYRRLPRSDNQK
jgi:predicted GNAT family N-acyltransferase